MSSDVTTILDPLRANADRHPDKPLFAFLDAEGRTTESFTYEAFLRRTGDLASHLHRTHPLKPRQRVLLVYPPGLEMICALYACVRLGLIPVPVYPPASHGFAAALHRMNAIAKDCRAAAVLTDRSYVWSLKLHRARTRIATLSFRRDYTSRLRWIVTSDAETGAGRGFPEVHSEILFLQYTSGSTREPRGVMVSHRNVLDNCHAVVDHTPVGVSWLPQYHDMGLIAFYLFSAIKGGTTYGCSPVDFIRRPALWLEAMSRHRATASAAPDFAYAYCLRPDKVDDESLADLDLGSLRILLNGAEPVRPRVFRAFLERFEPRGLRPAAFSAAYGLAEYTLAVSAHGREIRSFDARDLAEGVGRTAGPASPGETRKALVSCGSPLGTTEIRIVDTTGSAREVPEGRVGEVWVSGPGKCLGYWGRPELSERVFEARLDGDPEPARTWLRTGDLGFVRDGELFVCGRAKDVIIVRGANYYPQDIEAVVEEDPAVRPGCVASFATEGEGREEVVVVAEVRDRSTLPDAEALNGRVRRRLGIAVDLFVFIPARTIPKTSSGKISRYRARTRWRDGSLDVILRVEAARSSPDPGEVAEADAATGGSLHALFRRHGLTGAEERSLFETGLDSLGMVDFALDLERYLESRGASDLAAGIQVHWLQNIPLGELFELVEQVGRAAPRAKIRFHRAFAALRREQLEAERRMMRRDRELAVAAPRDGSTGNGAGRTPGGILLTAGTGFFGPFLLRSLLDRCDDPIHVLVRARDRSHAEARLEEGLASLGIPGAARPLEGWRRRVVPVPADLSLPRFGLTESAWGALCEGVHTVFHNGAEVNYLLDYASMRDTNVGGTLEVVRLASTGRPKVVNHVSTTFVFGWSTREVLFETDTNPDMELLDFGYSQSKWVSEQIVLRAMERGLAARVFRPALIAPSVAGGGHNFDISIRLLAFMLDHGISTTARNQVSLTPADVAANNIVAIADLPDTLGRTFHVTRDAYSSLSEVSAILGELTGTRFVLHPPKEFVPTMIERCRKGDLLFPLVNFLAHSVDNITAMEFKRYDSRNYREARARSPYGMPDPPLEDVVSGIVRFMIRHGILEGRGAELALERL